MRDPIDLYNNTLVPMVVEQSNRGERADIKHCGGVQAFVKYHNIF